MRCQEQVDRQRVIDCQGMSNEFQKKQKRHQVNEPLNQKGLDYSQPVLTAMDVMEMMGIPSLIPSIVEQTRD